MTAAHRSRVFFKLLDERQVSIQVNMARADTGSLLQSQLSSRVGGFSDSFFLLFVSS